MFSRMTAGIVFIALATPMTGLASSGTTLGSKRFAVQAGSQLHLAKRGYLRHAGSLVFNLLRLKNAIGEQYVHRIEVPLTPGTTVAAASRYTVELAKSFRGRLVIKKIALRMKAGETVHHDPDNPSFAEITEGDEASLLEKDLVIEKHTSKVSLDVSSPILAERDGEEVVSLVIEAQTSDAPFGISVGDSYWNCPDGRAPYGCRARIVASLIQL